MPRKTEIPKKKASAPKSSRADALEALFGVPVPQRLRTFLDDGEAEQYRARRMWDVPYFSSSDSFVLSYSMKDLKLLQEILSQDGEGAKLLRVDRLPFGYSVDFGFHVAVDTTAPTLPVWVFEHESGFQLHADSFDAFLAKLLKKGEKPPIEKLQAASERADALMDREKYEQAAVLLEQALSEFVPRRTPCNEPDDAVGNAYNLLGICKGNQDDLIGALAAYEAGAVAGCDAAAVNLIGIHADKGDFDQVIARGEALAEKLRFGGDNEKNSLRRHLGGAYIARGDERKATLTYHHLLKSSRTHPELRKSALEDLKEHQEKGLPHAALALKIEHWFGAGRDAPAEAEHAKLQRWWTSVPKTVQAVLKDAVNVSAARLGAEELAGIIALEELRLSGRRLKDLSFLSAFHKLRTLSLRENALEDVSALAALKSLRNLDLSENRLTTLEPLAGLTRLITLNVTNNRLSSLTGLEGMTELERVRADNNVLTSIAPLAGLESLEELHITDNHLLEDISPLAKCPRLTTVSCDRCKKLKRGILELAELPRLREVNRAAFPMEDLRPFVARRPGVLVEGPDRKFDLTPEQREQGRRWFEALKDGSEDLRKAARKLLKSAAEKAEEALEAPPSDLNLARAFTEDMLQFDDKGLTSLEPARPFTEATWVNVSNNPASDLSPLSGMAGVRTLLVRELQVTSLEPLADLVWVDDLQCSGNRLTSLAGIERMRGLRYLAAHQNPLRDIDALRGLRELRHLFLEETEVDSLEVLSGHTRLRRLWIYSTRVTDLSPLAGCRSLEELVCFALPGLSGAMALEDLPSLHTFTTHRSLSDEELAAFREARPDVEID